jgi:hypothetical protein
MPSVGFISASAVKPLMVDGRIRKPFGRGAVTYARQLAREMMGVEKEEFESYDIDRGNELEPEAIDFFERTFFIEGVSPEFTIHPEIEHFGGTADRIYPEYGIDIKSPNQKNHHDNLSEGMQLDDYKHQFQSYMAIYKLDRWALVSYNNSFPDHLKLVVAWMERDNEYIEKLEERVQLFYPVVLEELGKLKTYKPKLL